MPRLVLVLLALLAFVLPTQAEPARIVTAGAAVTEIAVALGLGPRLVAVDTSSRHLDETRDKPDIGYVRTLGAEGILSQRPDLILVSSEAGPPGVLEQLRGSGVSLVVVPNGQSLENIDDKIRLIAESTGSSAAAEKLATRVEAEVAALRESVSGREERPRVVFLLARHGGNLMAAGTDTAAHAMIEAVGGTNAAESFAGYKPLTPEFFAASRPDFILVSESVGGDDAQLLAQLPGLGSAPSGSKPSIVRVDDAAFLGFGPRTPSVAAEVATALRRP
jgi:iron complex transport system substrate-binding protein